MLTTRRSFLAYGFSVLLCSVVALFNQSDIENVLKAHNLFCQGLSICNHSNTANNIAVDENGQVLPDEFLDRLPVLYSTKVQPYCCGKCSCDPYDCVQYGTCCLDTFQWLPTVQESRSFHTPRCREGRLKHGELPGDSYWVYDKCAPDFGDIVSDTKRKCEHYSEYMLLETRIPVTESKTNMTYLNVFCAQCNHVSKASIVYWTLEIKCSKDVNKEFLNGLNLESLVGHLYSIPDCNLLYETPKIDNFSKPTCYLPDLISECNATGLWKTYDPVIEAACHSTISPYSGYKNLFCFMCNEIELPATGCEPNKGNMDIYSFSALLSFNIHSDNAAAPHEGDKCTINQLFDAYTEICRDLSCRFPFHLVSGQCIPLVEEISGLGFIVYLKMRPDKPINLSITQDLTAKLSIEVYTLFNSFPDIVYYAINTYYHEMERGQEIKAGPSMNKTQEANEDHLPLEKLAETAPPDLLPIEELDEPPIVSKNVVVDYFIARVRMYFYLSYTDKPLTVSFLEDILRLDEHDTDITYGENYANVHTTLSLEDLSVLELPNFTGDLTVNTGLVPMPSFTFYKLPKVRPPIQVLSGKTKCPKVTLYLQEYTFERFANSSMLLIEELDALIDFKYFLLYNESVVLICANEFQKAVDANVKTVKNYKLPDDAGNPQAVVSVVFTCISIICSLLTLLTYCLFAELRTQPGINNMCLLIHLIIAQVLFQFTLGATDAPDGICRLFGALIHYFWLTVLLWMNVCSYHMFTVFSRRTVTRRSNYRKTTLLYALYVLCVPLFFLAINIGDRYTATNGTDIGYGDDICYISTPPMVGYVFALPVGIIILTNIGFFIAVIIQVNRTQMKQPEKTTHSRNLLNIYTKLSTVTGLSWLFGFLYAFTNVNAFEYMFIILNSGIGMLLFLSFVCNQRVLRLYSVKFNILRSEKVSGRVTSLTEMNSKVTTESAASSADSS